jgi:DNA polymerase I-like protein with 3'-5' exonuclease and polymerase domains
MVSIAKLRRQGVPIIAAVHDELIAHVPEKDAEEVEHLIREALIDHPKIQAMVPLGAEGAIVDRWSDAKKPGWVPDHELQEAHA